MPSRFARFSGTILIALPTALSGLAASAATDDFTADFELIYRAPDDNPQLARAYDWRFTKSLLASWLQPSAADATADDEVTSEDLIEQRPQAERSFDISASGLSTVIRFGEVLTPGSQTRETGRARLTIDYDPAPADGHGPRLDWTLTATQPGWFALGFLGAQSTPHDAVTELYQPLVWQERRLPAERYLSVEAMAPFPGVMVTTGGTTYGLIPDPSAIPYRLPNLENSRFGLALRDPGDTPAARPQLFAPVMGTEHSFLEEGESFSFSIRLISRPDDFESVYRNLTTGLYQFKNHRRNATGTLNDTIENMVRFQMDDRYSGWNADLRGFDYKEDVYGTVKVVSALQALATARLMDNEEIFLRRAQPLVEYLLSREKYLFSFTGEQAKQNATHRMGGPAMEVSELAALHDLSGRRTPVFLDLARRLNEQDRILNLKKVSRAGSFINLLALYRATDDPALLAAAVADAENYLARRLDEPQSAVGPEIIAENSCFPTDFLPLWVDLFELYSETGDKRFLDAAHQGARDFTRWLWIHPVIPDGTVAIHTDGQVYESHLARRKENPKHWPAAPQEVPAWRVSQIGLFPESTLTAIENPAVLLAHHAPYFIRLAQATGDTLLYEFARSAVVGRYQNYPGYQISDAFTTFIQRADYPYHEYDDYFTYNQMYYNHVWPQIGILFDYLVADAAYRSAGAIHFPAQYAQGYAYLQSRIFGHAPGRIHSHEGLHLWMPAGLLRTDNLQINHLAARGPDGFYLVLLNESPAPQSVTVTLNPDILPLNHGHPYPVEILNAPNSQLGTLDSELGTLTTTVPALGYTALKISGLVVPGFFQDRFHDTTAAPLGPDSFVIQTTPFGPVHAQLHRYGAGRDLTRAYVWLDTAPESSKSVTLRHRTAPDDAWTSTEDKTFPFEFSLGLEGDETTFEWELDFHLPDGTKETIPGKPLQ